MQSSGSVILSEQSSGEEDTGETSPRNESKETLTVNALSETSPLKKEPFNPLPVVTAIGSRLTSTVSGPEGAVITSKLETRSVVVGDDEVLEAPTGDVGQKPVLGYLGNTTVGGLKLGDGLGNGLPPKLVNSVTGDGLETKTVGGGLVNVLSSGLRQTSVDGGLGQTSVGGGLGQTSVGGGLGQTSVGGGLGQTSVGGGLGQTSVGGGLGQTSVGGGPGQTSVGGGLGQTSVGGDLGQTSVGGGLGQTSVGGGLVQMSVGGGLGGVSAGGADLYGGLGEMPTASGGGLSVTSVGSGGGLSGGIKSMSSSHSGVSVGLREASVAILSGGLTGGHRVTPVGSGLSGGLSGGLGGGLGGGLSVTSVGSGGGLSDGMKLVSSSDSGLSVGLRDLQASNVARLSGGLTGGHRVTSVGSGGLTGGHRVTSVGSGLGGGLTGGQGGGLGGGLSGGLVGGKALLGSGGLSGGQGVGLGGGKALLGNRLSGGLGQSSVGYELKQTPVGDGRGQTSIGAGLGQTSIGGRLQGHLSVGGGLGQTSIGGGLGQTSVGGGLGQTSIGGGLGSATVGSGLGQASVGGNLASVTLTSGLGRSYGLDVCTLSQAHLAADYLTHSDMKRPSLQYTHILRRKGLFSRRELVTSVKGMLSRYRADLLEIDYELINSDCCAQIKADLRRDPNEAATILLEYLETKDSPDDLLKFCKFLREEAQQDVIGRRLLIKLAKQIEGALTLTTSHPSSQP